MATAAIIINKKGANLEAVHGNRNGLLTQCYKTAFNPSGVIPVVGRALARYVTRVRRESLPYGFAGGWLASWTSASRTRIVWSVVTVR